MPAVCGALTKAGTPCQSPPLRGRDRCLLHDPDAAAVRHAASAKGGRKRSNAERAKAQLPAGCLSNDQLRGLLGSTLARTLRGEVEPGVANAVANVARAYLAATEAAAIETLTDRLAILEAEAARLKRRS